jgi:hypothetical protein
MVGPQPGRRRDRNRRRQPNFPFTTGDIQFANCLLTFWSARRGPTHWPIVLAVTIHFNHRWTQMNTDNANTKR